MTRTRFSSAALTPMLLVALSLDVSASVAGAAQPQPRQGAGSRDRSTNVAPALSDNAALVYYSVWMNENREQAAAFSEAYGDIEYGKALPQAVSDYLALRKDDINRLVRAGKMKHCDFGADRSEGFNMVLPHLGKLRTAARMLNADAARCLLEGKPDDAADRFTAIFGMARHASSDRVLISSLVGIAIANVPVNGLVEHNGAAMLTPAGRAKVLAAVEKFDGSSGFKLKEAIEGERELAVDMTILRYGGADAGRRFADEVLVPSMGSGAPGSPPGDREKASPDIAAVRQMDEAALHAEVRKLAPFYAEVVKVWDSPNAEARLKELVQRGEGGEYGALGKYLLPALGKCHASQEKGVGALQSVNKALRQAGVDAPVEAPAESSPSKSSK